MHYIYILSTTTLQYYIPLKYKAANNIITLLIVAFLCVSCRSVEPPAPYGACPTASQIAWQRMEMNMFCHFGPNTFTDKEWGDGTEAEELFDPTDLDCNQWAETAKRAGMKGIIVTAKHHDGFCLWPNPHSTHTVLRSPWKDGKGDLLALLRQACDNNGLKMGIYISPWDRNAPTYGTEAYNETFRLTLQDALSRYGEIFEQWFDGANGEGPIGKKQTYDWPLFNSTVKSLQPNAVIFSDVGPGCRWVGNENGEAGESCWSTLNIDNFTPGAGAPHTDTLNQGNRNGNRWVPAETDVSIRPGWFYHPNEHPKSLKELLRIYYTSVGRNSLLLLNVPPDRRGRIPEEDSLRLAEFRDALDTIFANNLASDAKIEASNIRGNNEEYGTDALVDNNFNSYWATDDDILTPTLIITFDKAATFNRIVLQEYIPLGQRIERFHIEYKTPSGKWETLTTATTIGYKRILLFTTTTTDAIRIIIDQSLACPTINALGIYLDEYDAFGQDPIED